MQLIASLHKIQKLLKDFFIALWYNEGRKVVYIIDYVEAAKRKEVFIWNPEIYWFASHSKKTANA